MNGTLRGSSSPQPLSKIPSSIITAAPKVSTSLNYASQNVFVVKSGNQRFTGTSSHILLELSGYMQSHEWSEKPPNNEQIAIL